MPQQVNQLVFASGLSTAVLDSLPEPGGQITAMYPEKAIFDVGGFPAIRGRELVANLVAQAAPFSPGYLLGQQAVGLERGGDEGFVITTSTGARVRARSTAIAACRAKLSTTRRSSASNVRPPFRLLIDSTPTFSASLDSATKITGPAWSGSIAA